MWSLLPWGIAHLQHLGCHVMQEKLVWKCDKTIFGAKDTAVVQEDMEQCGMWPHLWLKLMGLGSLTL